MRLPYTAFIIVRRNHHTPVTHAKLEGSRLWLCPTLLSLIQILRRMLFGKASAPRASNRRPSPSLAYSGGRRRLPAKMICRKRRYSSTVMRAALPFRKPRYISVGTFPRQCATNVNEPQPILRYTNLSVERILLCSGTNGLQPTAPCVRYTRA